MRYPELGAKLRLSAAVVSCLLQSSLVLGEDFGMRRFGAFGDRTKRRHSCEEGFGGLISRFGEVETWMVQGRAPCSLAA